MRYEADTPRRYAANKIDVPAYPAAAPIPNKPTPVATNPTSFVNLNSFHFPLLTFPNTTFMIFESRIAATRNAIETPIGLAIAPASISPPSCEITLTNTSPITSSIIAAVTSTVPSLVVFNLTDARIANVVPSDVDDNAAPAAKAVKLDVPGISGIRINDNPIGKQIPVNATNIAGANICFNIFKSVVRPPTSILEVKM